MPNYRRPNVSGGTYFITQVTYQRESCFDIETPLDGSYLTDSEARPRNRFSQRC
jgi:REP element-mobilizing transposase RayT